MRLYFVASFFLCLLLCCQAKRNPIYNKDNKDSIPVYKNISPTKKLPKNIIVPAASQAHPKARLLMKDSFFFKSPDEAGPFGNNDGLIAFTALHEWRQTNKTGDLKVLLTTLVNDFGYPKFDLDETDILKLTPYLQQYEFGSRFISGTDAAIIAIAFGQLYLEGTIDRDFKEMAKTAIRRQLNPGLLAAWGDPYQMERKVKLIKMMAVLEK